MTDKDNKETKDDKEAVFWSSIIAAMLFGSAYYGAIQPIKTDVSMAFGGICFTTALLIFILLIISAIRGSKT